jgi:uncharacterized membrane protein
VGEPDAATIDSGAAKAAVLNLSKSLAQKALASSAQGRKPVMLRGEPKCYGLRLRNLGCCCPAPGSAPKHGTPLGLVTACATRRLEFHVGQA